MTWTLTDIIIGIVMLIVIGGLYYLIRDARKKGIHVCGKACGGCPHPCHPDGTRKTMEEMMGIGETGPTAPKNK